MKHLKCFASFNGYFILPEFNFFGDSDLGAIAPNTVTVSLATTGPYTSQYIYL